MEAEPWTKADLSACENEAVLGARIAELHRMARAQRDKHVVARERIAELEKELEAVSTESENAGSGLRSRVSRLRTR